MPAQLMDVTGATSEAPAREDIGRRVAGKEFFWLDLLRPTEAEFGLLRDVFEFHPLAIEDSEHFGQRAKLDEYDDFLFLVVYGARPQPDELVEVHCFYMEHFLVTVHRDECPAFEDIRKRHAGRRAPPTSARLLHEILDGLVDTFFPVLSDFDDQIDELETAIFARPSEEQLQEILSLKRRLLTIHKVSQPQEELLGRLLARADELPGMTPEVQRHFHDVYDHLVRIGELIDSYREFLTGAAEVYLSSASNQLNVVVKRLTVFAAVFLPLSFITGFFGQNFGKLVDQIDTWAAFVGLSIGIQLATVALLLLYFRRQRWF